MSLWYSADWKEYVWLCRKRGYFPSKFDELSNAQVIKGHICRKLPQLEFRIKKENIQTAINEDFCLTYKGQNGQAAKCTQWAFIGQDLDILVQLSKAVQGKLHIDVYASSMLRDLY